MKIHQPATPAIHWNPRNNNDYLILASALLWNKVDIITASWSTPTSWAVLEVLHQICSASVCEDVFACVAHSCADLESLVISFKGRQSAKLSGYKLRLFGAKCPKLARLIFEKVSPNSLSDRFWFSWSSFVGVTTRFSFSNLSNLTLLVVENGEDLGDHHLAQIATLQKLQTLGISYGAFAVSEKPTKLGWLKLISDAGSAARARQAVVKEELPNSSVHQLQSLRFRNIKTGFDDDVVRTIASGFASSLKSLDLTGCQKISDWGLTSVVTNCSKLQRLELGENEVLEGTGWLEDLVQKPNFGYLHFTPSCGSNKHKTEQKIVIPERITSRAADKATAICSDLLFS